jgi:2-methylcitrate dehydratase PrpD
MERVALSVNPDIERYGAIMDITLADGEVLRAEIDRSRGNPENPLSWDDLQGKFEGLVRPILGADTGALYDALRAIDEPGGLPRILTLVAGNG